MYRVLILGLGIVFIVACQSSPSPRSTTNSPTQPTSSMEFKTIAKPNLKTDLHILKIKPGNDYVIEPMISNKTNALSEFDSSAIAVINAGFFDPVNQQSTSHIQINSKIVANPRNNDRLTQNPKLKPYLPQIFNRGEFRRYQCGNESRYDIAKHDAVIPSDCQLIDAIGAGPQLLPNLTTEVEAFTDSKTGRDAIGASQLNARSAIGITADGMILLVMAEQKQNSGGVNLMQLAEILKSEGAVQALNLDGGTSSALLFQSKLIRGKRDEFGKSIDRPVKSVLVVKRRS